MVMASAEIDAAEKQITQPRSTLSLVVMETIPSRYRHWSKGAGNECLRKRYE